MFNTNSFKKLFSFTFTILLLSFLATESRAETGVWSAVIERNLEQANIGKVNPQVVAEPAPRILETVEEEAAPFAQAELDQVIAEAVREEAAPLVTTFVSAMVVKPLNPARVIQFAELLHRIDDKIRSNLSALGIPVLPLEASPSLEIVALDKKVDEAANLSEEEKLRLVDSLRKTPSLIYKIKEKRYAVVLKKGGVGVAIPLPGGETDFDSLGPGVRAGAGSPGDLRRDGLSGGSGDSLPQGPTKRRLIGGGSLENPSNPEGSGDLPDSVPGLGSTGLGIADIGETQEPGPNGINITLGRFPGSGRAAFDKSGVYKEGGGKETSVGDAKKDVDIQIENPWPEDKGSSKNKAREKEDNPPFGWRSDRDWWYDGMRKSEIQDSDLESPWARDCPLEEGDDAANPFRCKALRPNPMNETPQKKSFPTVVGIKIPGITKPTLVNPKGYEPRDSEDPAPQPVPVKPEDPGILSDSDDTNQ